MMRTLAGGAAAAMAAAMAMAGTSRGSAAVAQEAELPAAEEVAAAASAPLFASHEPLIIRIETNLQRLMRDRGQDSEERPGRVTVMDESGVTLDVRVRTRGNFRLQRRTCEFPPLRLNFRTGQADGTVFGGEDKLKLVTHCRDSDDFEQNVLLEYAIYRIYQLFTSQSFRARLARVTYVDGERQDSVTRYGVLLEDDGRMAARLGGRVVERPGLGPTQVDPEALVRLTVFQYFIGNTDWSLSTPHNLVIVVGENGVPTPVPYDFDWSGVIAPPYAKPDPGLPIQHVRERYFMLGCVPPEHLQPIVDEFVAFRDAIVTLVREVPGIKPETVRRTVQYFEEFYETIGNPRRARAAFQRRC